MNSRRPVAAKRSFIDAVLAEMKALDKDYNHEVAKGLMPFIEMADAMTRADIEKLKRRRDKSNPPISEAAE